jgi:hypothetical protein
MRAIHDLLARLGFVRLRDFGLLLTTDRRIVSTRPAVLDDGFGARIVGWEDGDLAVLELAPWGEAKAPEPARVIAPLARPAPVPPPVVKPPVPARVKAREPTPPIIDEADDWEWEIAMARARAAAEEVDKAKDEWLAEQPTRLRPTASTVIPVPSFPAVDARMVRPREEVTVSILPAPRRFPRASNQRCAVDEHAVTVALRTARR